MDAQDGERWIVLQNIERFKKLLEAELDDGRRREITWLLDTETKKLKALHKSG